VAKPRKDINTLADNELDNYIHAIQVLRQRSQSDPTDPTGFDFQAALHNDMNVGPCEHGSDLFLPWHRAHLHYFERLLQLADPPRTAEVTIPYWDWLHPESVGKFPRAFDKPGLSEPDRDVGLEDLPDDTLAIVTETSDWNQFGGYPKDNPDGDYGDLEFRPHNDMHSFFIGGKMSDPGTAAQDPIYFSFHCFIDLLWSEWQRRNGSPAPTSPDADLRGFTNQPKHTVRDFQDTPELDYEYQYTEKLTDAFSIEPSPRGRGRLLAIEPMVTLTRAFSQELQQRSRLRFGFQQAPPGRVAVVRLNQLKVPTTGSYKLKAYVHPRDVDLDPSDDTAASYYVGYVVLWRAHTGSNGEHHSLGDGEMESHHPISCTVRFDVSDALARSSAGAADQVLTLQYMPAPLPGGEPAPAELVEEVELREVLVESYGKLRSPGTGTGEDSARP
jgi:hypothetical protein